MANAARARSRTIVDNHQQQTSKQEGGRVKVSERRDSLSKRGNNTIEACFLSPSLPLGLWIFLLVTTLPYSASPSSSLCLFSSSPLLSLLFLVVVVVCCVVLFALSLRRRRRSLSIACVFLLITVAYFSSVRDYERLVDF
jgi:hypothetical protein